MSTAPPPPSGTIEVRDGEAFDIARAEEYLRGVIPSLHEGPMEVRQFPTGASNLTYWIRLGNWEAVLRRPPLGPVPPRAHDMEREGNLLSRLHVVFPLAPAPFAVCSDPSILGTPFHVMEYRRGVVIDSKFPPEVDATPASCREIGIATVETLADLHLVDWRAAGLEAVGRPDGFLGRQVDGWIGRYEKARTDEIAGAEPLMARLRRNVPASPGPTVIHNDYKLNNLLFDPQRRRVSAVLDWEMATIGDPLLDLAVFLGYWIDPDDPEELKAILPTVTAREGFPRRAEMVEIYAKHTGREPVGLEWYLTFAYFKLAVILQQIYARWVRGQTRDERFARFGERVRTLVEHAYMRTG
jgi:aminoglycoside phosphotransferase (APT) family kinase protein